jgi:hypothetical protein
MSPRKKRASFGTRRFNALTRDQEIALLRGDDNSFSATQLYLMPLIHQAVKRMELRKEESQRLASTLLADVPVAASRFLRSLSRSAAYSFATYFTWYIHERCK